jgi:23S rRNA (guanosine2251-2'-O)-methyltransferase
LRTRPPARAGVRAAERHASPRVETDLLYGRNAVRESLRAGRRRFRRLLLAAGSEQQARVAELVALAHEHALAPTYVERERLDALVTSHHQGVVLEASPYRYADTPNLHWLATERRVLLALDGLEDPQNLGTLLRTAEATNVAAIVIPTDRSASVTPAVVNASSGAVEHLDVVREVNLARWLGRARDAGFWIVGLSGDAGTQSLFETSMSGPVVVVVGAEGFGLRRLVAEVCDMLVSIPMVGQIESLNAAVAGSIALYEAFREPLEA